MKHIRFASNLKNKAYEHTGGWIKGMIPVFKLAIPSDELPLLMNLFILDRNTLPVTNDVNQPKDPLAPPVRKTLVDGNSGHPLPLSASIASAALRHIAPTHTILYIDIIKKNAVNYNKTGLSPPLTVSSHSTALLSASNRSIRSHSAFGARIYHARFHIIQSSVTHKTNPLSLLTSGGVNLKGRGFCLFNNLFIKEAHHD